jgi:hypothetical protein
MIRIKLLLSGLGFGLARSSGEIHLVLAEIGCQGFHLVVRKMISLMIHGIARARCRHQSVELLEQIGFMLAGESGNGGMAFPR